MSARSKRNRGTTSSSMERRGNTYRLTESHPMRGKSIIVRSPAHLKLVAGLPCLVTGIRGQTQAHHLLRVRDSYGRDIENRGVGMKAGDNYAVPLHYKIHDALHRDGDEIEFFARFGIHTQSDIANGLYLSLRPWDMEDYLCDHLMKTWRKNARNPEIKRILSK